MSVKESPLQAVKRIYGNKDKLVELVQKTLSDLGEQTEDLRSASNKKLLRLAEVGKEVKEKYGSKEKLVSGLTAALNRAKDSDYAVRLRGMSLTRLMDLMHVAEQRARNLGKRSKAA